MPLTLGAYGTHTTVGNTGRIEHAERSIVFWASFLLVEDGSLWTAERAIGLKHKVLSSQASYTSRACPLRRRDQTAPPVEARRQVGRRGEQGERTSPSEPERTR